MCVQEVCEDYSCYVPMLFMYACILCMYGVHFGQTQITQFSHGHRMMTPDIPVTGGIFKDVIDLTERPRKTCGPQPPNLRSDRSPQNEQQIILSC